MSFPRGQFWRLQAQIEIESHNRRERAAYGAPFEVLVIGMNIGRAHRWGDQTVVPLRPVATSLGWIVHWEKGLDDLLLARDGETMRVSTRSVFGDDYVPLPELETLLGLPPSRREGGSLLIGPDPPAGVVLDPATARPAELWVDGRRLSRQAVITTDGRSLVPAEPLALVLGAIFRLRAPDQEIEVNYHRLPAYLLEGRVLVELEAMLPVAGSRGLQVEVRPGPGSALPAAPHPLRHVPGRPGRVAITFDDYLLPVTAGLLDILEQRNARATFFVIGSGIEQYPELASRILAGGSELANHSWSHQHPFAFTEDRLRAEILAADLTIRDHAGLPAPFFRPPGGYHDAFIRAVAADLGLTTVLWSVHGGDAASDATPERIARNVLTRAHPGAVVVLHMTRAATVEALPAIIDGLRAAGLEPVTLTELLALSP